MARDGYRIFDSDTHVGPDAGILAGYLSAAEKERLAGWAAYESRDRHGRVTYMKGQRHYRRRLGIERLQRGVVERHPGRRIDHHSPGPARLAAAPQL